MRSRMLRVVPGVMLMVAGVVLASGCSTSNGGGILIAEDTTGGSSGGDTGANPYGGGDAAGDPDGSDKPDIVSQTDAGGSDAVSDAGSQDVGAFDAGPEDAGIDDSGALDAGTVDGGGLDDVGAPDSGGDDIGGVEDGSAQDVTGKDTGGVDDTSVPPKPESCINGKDDDGDGFVDCADSDCKGNAACKEDCDNGKDDDADGLVDCADSDCEGEVACSSGTESCYDVLICAYEAGCGCTLGENCPADSGPCIQACFSSQTCYEGCLASVSPTLQATWDTWQGCLQTWCAGITDDPTFEKCIFANCTEEYQMCYVACDEGEGKTPGPSKADLMACSDEECTDVTTETELNQCYLQSCLTEMTECFYSGTATCNEGYFGCYTACDPNDGDNVCETDCLQSMSTQGAYDLFSWENCRSDLCDTDADGTYDSIECAIMAYYFACSDQMGTCVPEWTGATSCHDTMTCLLGCGGLGEAQINCIGDCYVNMSEASLGQTANLVSCIVSACGTTTDVLTPACAEQALSGACSAEAVQCGF